MVSQKKVDLNAVRAEISALVKSQFFNILRANPSVSRFYGLSPGSIPSNPKEAKILAEKNIFFRGLGQMSVPKVRICTHIKVNGARCGSPTMRDEQFCYFHQRLLRGVKTPPNVRIHPVALIEDEASIQVSLMEVINALARNHIDLRRADLILKALYIAVRNSQRARFQLHETEMVREVPDYPAPAPAAGHAQLGSQPSESPLLEAPALPRIDPFANWDSMFNIDAPLTPTPKPSRRIRKITAASVDPTQRKPPARAGLPAEPRKAAASARSQKTK
jgi:hypothetical protein